LELAVLFDKCGNLRVKCAANLNKTGVGRVLVNERWNLRNSVTANLARVSENETGDRFALFLGHAVGVDGDLN
jgi:hypothetical protein